MMRIKAFDAYHAPKLEEEANNWLEDMGGIIEIHSMQASKTRLVFLYSIKQEVN